MHNSDLVEILVALTEAERKRLGDFLNSASADRIARAESERLLYYLLERLETGDTIARSVAYQFVFPDQAEVENKLEKCMSDTLKLVRSFVATEMAGRSMGRMQQSYYLQKFYNERGLEKKFQQARKQTQKLGQAHQAWSPQDFYFQFQSESEEMAFQSARNLKKDDHNLWNTVHALDEYYLVERLWHTCLLLNQNQLAPLALPQLKEWLLFDLQSPQLNWFFEKPLGQLFGQAIELLSNAKDSSGQTLRDFVELLYRHESQLWKDYLSSFEVFACNYGIRHLNRGQEEFAAPVFQIQQRRIKSGRIYLDGKIKASEFQSITSVGLRLGELDWVKKFHEDHRSRIIGSMSSEEYFQFAYANYLYHSKDFEPALNTLVNSAYEDMDYKFMAKTLEIKILWEMSHIAKKQHFWGEMLESRVDAAIIYFFREKKLSPNRKTMGKRFADTMKRIINAESKSDVARLEIILQDIGKAEYIAERQWLCKIVVNILAHPRK